MAHASSELCQISSWLIALQHTLSKVHSGKIQRIAIIIETKGKKEYKIKGLTQSQSRVRQKPQGTNSRRNSLPSILPNAQKTFSAQFCDDSFTNNAGTQNSGL